MEVTHTHVFNFFMALTLVDCGGVLFSVGADWFVDHVVIRDISRGLDAFFHCGKWICERRGFPSVRYRLMFYGNA